MPKSMDDNIREHFSKDVMLSGIGIMSLEDWEFEELRGRLVQYAWEIELQESEALRLRKLFLWLLGLTVSGMVFSHLLGLYLVSVTVAVLGVGMLYILYRDFQKLVNLSISLKKVYGILEKSVDFRLMMGETSRLID